LKFKLAIHAEKEYLKSSLSQAEREKHEHLLEAFKHEKEVER